MAGDGGLRQWQVVNEVNHLAHVPYSFFAIKYDHPSIYCIIDNFTYSVQTFLLVIHGLGHVSFGCTVIKISLFRSFFFPFPNSNLIMPS